MADIELFIHSAEIAGVFVGFGALIAVRSGAAMAVDEFNNIRWVVTVGIWVVIVALAPIFIAGYGIDGHALWLVSGLLALALFAVVIVVFARTPENQSQAKAAYLAVDEGHPASVKEACRIDDAKIDVVAVSLAGVDPRDQVAQPAPDLDDDVRPYAVGQVDYQLLVRATRVRSAGMPPMEPVPPSKDLEPGLVEPAAHECNDAPRTTLP